MSNPEIKGLRKGVEEALEALHGLGTVDQIMEKLDGKHAEATTDYVFQVIGDLRAAGKVDVTNAPGKTYMTGDSLVARKTATA